jgi:Fe-S-cluster containining protein
MIPHDIRPMMCRLFPFIPVPVYSDTSNGIHAELVLMVARCPQWRVFGEMHNQAKEEFNGKKD